MYTQTWYVQENQNGSNELTHHGIKGMKWGIRRTPEQLGHKTESDVKVVSRPTTSFRIKNYGRFTESQKSGINSNRIEFIFGTPTNSKTGSYYFTDSKGDSRKATITKNEKGQYDIHVHNQDGKPGFARVMSDDNYEAILTSLGYSEQEAKEIIATADLRWMEENNIQYEKEELDEKLEELEKRRNRRRDLTDQNAEMMAFKAQKMSTLKKDKTWKQKIVDGVSEVGYALKKFGDKAVNTVKDVGSKVASGVGKAAQKGKNFVTSLFSKEKGSSTKTTTKISKKQYVRQKWETLDNVTLPYTPSLYYYNGLSRHPRLKK